MTKWQHTLTDIQTRAASFRKRFSELLDNGHELQHIVHGSHVQQSHVDILICWLLHCMLGLYICPVKYVANADISKLANIVSESVLGICTKPIGSSSLHTHCSPPYIHTHLFTPVHI